MRATELNSRALSRLKGIRANDSAGDHSEVEQNEQTVDDNLELWADAMARLHKHHGVKVLGGCCGTDDRYLRAICERVCRVQK